MSTLAAINTQHTRARASTSTHTCYIQCAVLGPKPVAPSTILDDTTRASAEPDQTHHHPTVDTTLLLDKFASIRKRAVKCHRQLTCRPSLTARILCGAGSMKRSSVRLVCLSVRQTVTSFDHNSGVRRVCCPRAGDIARSAGCGAQQQMRVVSC